MAKEVIINKEEWWIKWLWYTAAKSLRAMAVAKKLSDRETKEVEATARLWEKYGDEGFK